LGTPLRVSFAPGPADAADSFACEEHDSDHPIGHGGRARLRRPNRWPKTFSHHEFFHACTLLAALCYQIVLYFALFRWTWRTSRLSA